MQIGHSTCPHYPPRPPPSLLHIPTPFKKGAMYICNCKLTLDQVFIFLINLYPSFCEKTSLSVSLEIHENIKSMFKKTLS